MGTEDKASYGQSGEWLWKYGTDQLYEMVQVISASLEVSS